MTVTTKSPGRPRRAEADQDILDATIVLLSEVGFAQLSMEKIAAKASVTRPTIYRRWKSRDEVVIAAIEASFSKFIAEAPDTGNVWDDVRIRLEHVIRMLTKSPMGGVIAALVSERKTNPDVRKISQKLDRARRKHLRDSLEKGQARGEIDRKADLELLIDLLLGAIYFRLLITGTPLKPKLAADIVATVLPSPR